MIIGVTPITGPLDVWTTSDARHCTLKGFHYISSVVIIVAFLQLSMLMRGEYPVYLVLLDALERCACYCVHCIIIIGV